MVHFFASNKGQRFGRRVATDLAHRNCLKTIFLVFEDAKMDYSNKKIKGYTFSILIVV